MRLEPESSSPGSGKGPLKPRPSDSGASILEAAMRRPATPARAPEPTPAVTTHSYGAGARAGRPMPPDDPNAVTQWGGMARGGPRGPVVSQYQADQADLAKQAEADREEREKILGISTGALTTTPEMLKDQLKQLTPDEYAKLAPRQRAAVDFNTMLATAVKKDLTRQDRYKNVGEQQQLTYDKSVENMFGEDRGSDLYAPETMAVLRQLKIDDPTDDLDDYLGMKVAITEDDLKNLTPPAPSPAAPRSAQSGYEGLEENDRDRLGLQETLVDKTQQMEESLAKGKAMLQSFTATAAAERADDLGRLGGSSPLASRPGLGFSATQFTQSGAPADLNTYFRTAFDALADEKQADSRPKVLEALKADLYPDELEAFKSYADTRLRNTHLYGASMGDNPQAEYTSPKEFRKLLGLDQ